MGATEWPLAVGALVAVVLLAAAVTGRAWIFEAAAGLALLAGIGLACGALDRAPLASPRTGDEDDAAGSAGLRAAVDARLAGLDPVEHRRLDLGAPWPSVVVGPTGVAVIAAAPAGSGGSVRRLEHVVGEVERALAGTAGDLPVRGFLVLARPPSMDGVIDVTDQRLRRLGVDELRTELAQGPLASMASVAEAHGRLAVHLAPDLSVHP